jgi:hypothetical protein
LVLALDRERVDQRVFQLLPAALIVATLASFAAANLMVFTSSLPDAAPTPAAPGGLPVASGLRLFLVAITTVHTAIALFLFTLMLLPAVYDVQGATAFAQRLGFWAFVLFEGSSAAAVVQLARAPRHPGVEAALAVSGGLAAALVVYFALRSGDAGERAQLFPFILSTAAVCAALAYFSVTFDRLGPPDSVDTWFFCLASILPTASLLGLGTRIYREGRPGRAGKALWTTPPLAEEGNPSRSQRTDRV